MPIAKETKLQSVGEILSEMGFEKGAKQSTKAAFIKYLFKQAYGVDVEPPTIYQTSESKPEQLAFNFDENKPKVG